MTEISKHAFHLNFLSRCLSRKGIPLGPRRGMGWFGGCMHVRPDSRSSNPFRLHIHTRTHQDWGLAPRYMGNYSQGWLREASKKWHAGAEAHHSVGSVPFQRWVKPASFLPSAPVTSLWFRPSDPASCPSANSKPRSLTTAPSPYHTPTFWKLVGC